MPPIPSSTSNPPNDDIAAALRSLSLRHAHLSTTLIPALAQSTSSLKDQQVLAAQVREDLDDYGRAVESLEALVEDLEREWEKATWRVIVHDWAGKYAR
jgi:protein transport protein SEC20